ncbi:MAG: oxygen-independent coproporphyrinogen III oxidase, partial [Deltaproteobacteria bacterium]|nr:oxygen-independent coproporphyrinogen III oxidase [Deltaproteobacteria bacterium]
IQITSLLSSQRQAFQMHWGGGTPTYLNPDEIRKLGELIRKHFSLNDSVLEASCEIDPRELTKDHIQALKEVGFNRLSMGVQDFNEQVQKAVNRVQPESITRDAVQWGRELGFKSINLDLIYGLPFQTLKSFEETLDRIIDVSPERLAIFNYAHVPWLKKHMNLIRAEDLPSPDQKLAILKMTIEKLSAAGYDYIGMDHFAKPTDDLAIAQKNKTLSRNFQGYSTMAGYDVYALGMSAISQLQNVYAQNAKSLPEYYKAVSANELPTQVGYRMTADDHLRKEVINTLMCHFELDENSIERKFNISFETYFASSLARLEEFKADGFVKRHSGKILIEGMGRLLVRNIVMCFDAYLDEMITDRPLFSRTV